VALDRALADAPQYSMAILLREVLDSGAPPRLARLPMTPEEVAASYAETDEEHADGESVADSESGDDAPADGQAAGADEPAGGGPELGDTDFGDPGYGDCDPVEDGEFGMDQGGRGCG
jgi:hypothetical protein